MAYARSSVIALIALAPVAAGASSDSPPQPDAADVAAGATLYAEHCASCHGAELEGVADWRTPDASGRLPAPPHDDSGHTWHHGDAMLFTYTKLGGRAALAEVGVDYDSGMPAFGDVLTDREIREILAFIKSTWPERVQQIQTSRTQADRNGDN